MSTHGDNKNSAHNLKHLINEEEHILAYCTECKKRFYVRPKDRKAYAKLFKKDSLQPGGNNLYYKYYGNMNVV